MCINSSLICGTTRKRNREEQALINSVGYKLKDPMRWLFGLSYGRAALMKTELYFHYFSDGRDELSLR